jgi:hypothetical protein
MTLLLSILLAHDGGIIHVLVDHGSLLNRPAGYDDLERIRVDSTVENYAADAGVCVHYLRASDLPSITDVQRNGLLNVLSRATFREGRRTFDGVIPFTEFYSRTCDGTNLPPTPSDDYLAVTLGDAFFPKVVQYSAGTSLGQRRSVEVSVGSASIGLRGGDELLAVVRSGLEFRRSKIRKDLLFGQKSAVAGACLTVSPGFNGGAQTQYAFCSDTGEADIQAVLRAAMANAYDSLVAIDILVRDWFLKFSENVAVEIRCGGTTFRQEALADALVNVVVGGVIEQGCLPDKIELSWVSSSGARLTSGWSAAKVQKKEEVQSLIVNRIRQPARGMLLRVVPAQSRCALDKLNLLLDGKSMPQLGAGFFILPEGLPQTLAKDALVVRGSDDGCGAAGVIQDIPARVEGRDSVFSAFVREESVPTAAWANLSKRSDAICLSIPADKASVKSVYNSGALMLLIDFAPELVTEITGLKVKPKKAPCAKLSDDSKWLCPTSKLTDLSIETRRSICD